MIKIKTLGEFMTLVLWVFLATWLINFMIDLLDTFTPKSLPLRQIYRGPYTYITGQLGSGSGSTSTSSTTGATGS